MVGRSTIVNEDTVKVGINKDAIKIGFIGAGYMGYGMAHNLLKNNYSVSVIAHKNRKPIDRLIDEGAIECKSMKELGEDNNVIVMCVTNTPIATEVANEIVRLVKHPYADKFYEFENGKAVLFSKKIDHRSKLVNSTVEDFHRNNTEFKSLIVAVVRLSLIHI